MEKKDMVIVGLVVLLVLVVAFSAGNFTGYQFKRSCSDTDGGSNFIKGTISGTDTAGNSYEMTDYCDASDSSILKEYSCSSDTYQGWTSNTVSCDNGCVDGACV